MGMPTYGTFADVQKCFDKLWLNDGIIELWNCGMTVRDCIMTKKPQSCGSSQD